MKTVAITGGAGFIGYWTAKRLLEEGFEVKILDNLHTAHMLSKIRELGLEVHRIDVRDAMGLERAFKGSDYVIHLAALISVEESSKVPELYHEVNATGTLNVLKAAMKAGVDKVIYGSSAAVYGIPDKLPIQEDHPTRPISIYGASKLAAESYCSSFYNTFGLRTLILRYFNAYGPGQSEEYAGVIKRFIERIRDNKPPIIYGDGLQTRDFIYVGDVANANLLALHSHIDFGIFNIASGKSISILSLAKMILDLTNSNLEPIFAPPRKGDIRHSEADIRKAREMLGFEPQTDLESGIKKVIEQMVKLA